MKNPASASYGGRRYNRAMTSIEPQIPLDLHKALRADPKAFALWKTLTPVARRDFISWIESAKQSETRKRRVDSMCSRLLSGKRRPSCYALVPMSLYTAISANTKAKTQWKTLTPTERRDFVSWINNNKQSEVRTTRIGEVCLMLSRGKRSP